MRLEQLALVDFRSYAGLELGLGPRQNFLVGPNGAGKTNLLEAIRVGAHGRSHRGARDADLARWGTAAYRVRLRARGRAGPLELEVSWRQGLGKRASADRAPLPRIADLFGRLPVVTFSPQDLDLVQAGPHFRRRYLDLLLCQLRPAYYDAWATYQHVLAQRNRLLAAVGPPSPAEMAVWDEQLVAAGVPLLVERRRVTGRLADLVPRFHAAIARAPEQLGVVYAPGVALPGGGGQEDLTEAFRRHLARTRLTERRRRATVAGPHRDDLVLRLDGQDARTFASQGQQRTAALALKLAELELLGEVGEEPVLLLDDVLSELDPDRRHALLEVLERPGQTLVTAAAREGVPPGRGDARTYEVGGGQVVPLPA